MPNEKNCDYDYNYLGSVVLHFQDRLHLGTCMLERALTMDKILGKACRDNEAILKPKAQSQSNKRVEKSTDNKYQSELIYSKTYIHTPKSLRTIYKQGAPCCKISRQKSARKNINMKRKKKNNGIKSKPSASSRQTKQTNFSIIAASGPVQPRSSLLAAAHSVTM